MIYENIGRRSILKGIGAAMGNPLGLFQKAAVATAKELAANVVVNRNITKCTPDMIPQIIESNIFGTYRISVENGVYQQVYGGGWEVDQEGKPNNYNSGVYKNLDVNDVGANIAKYFKNIYDNYHLIKKSKTLKIYDICNIDYAYLEKIYNKSIPEDLIQFKGGHERKKNELFENPVYDLNMNEYVNFKVPTQYFYNELIKRKVEHFYKNDLYFFKNCNFNYILKLK